MKMKIFKNSSKIFAAVIISLSFIITASAADSLVPLGHTTGIKISSSGAMVVGFSDETTVSPARQAGLATGDIIVKINGREISSNSEILNAVSESCGNALTVEYVRNGKTNTASVTPAKNPEGDFAIGIWVRDSVAGIGTLTYLNPEDMTYGALGHGISEGETNTLVPLRDGALLPSTVANVIKGRAGHPGELVGNFERGVTFAEISKNTEAGIFGKITNDKEIEKREALPIAKRNEIKRGAATILSNIQGDEVREYDVEITSIYFDGEKTKNMLIRATDPELLSRTGGIVCGMSGSTIIQDGKLVGAVTHVLVN
ncbi:MAG: SpoIVB peptidase, partial [Oscillospiraceae bacterium]|nr:SpoIVB peptidase [Oscillospiraceae bacterium]